MRLSPEDMPLLYVAPDSQDAVCSTSDCCGDVAPVKADIIVNGKTINFVIDTGAHKTIIPESVYRKQYADIPLKRSNVKLKSYSKNNIPVLGEMTAEVQYEGEKYTLPLIVAKGENISLFGRSWMKVIKLNWKEIFSVQATVRRDSESHRTLGEVSGHICT